VIHCQLQSVPPLLAHPPDPPPGNDAAPLAGGAGVSGPIESHNLTRLPSIPLARHNAPAGTSRVATDRIAGHAAKQQADVLAVIVTAGEFATGGPVESADQRGPEGGAA